MGWVFFPLFYFTIDVYSIAEYSFVIPHDMQTLVEFMGGNSTFESRLDTMVFLHFSVSRPN